MANILIVDDNEGIRESLKDYFHDLGYEPIVSAAQAQALQTLRTESVDIVLSDQVLEDSTGLELFKEMKALRLDHEPKFILMTGHASPQLAAEAHWMGVDLFLTKPFQLPALALAVEHVLGRVPTAEHPVFRASESFYHDFFVTLNPVLPRLLMMLEGRYGELNPQQDQALRGVVDIWRKLAWTMVDFQARLRDPRPAGPHTDRWHGPEALGRVIKRVAPDLMAASISTELLRDPRLPLAEVHIETAETLLEAAVLRLAAFSAPGAQLLFSWERAGDRLVLIMFSDHGKQDLAPEQQRIAAVVPPVMPLLDQSGVHFKFTDQAGPWQMDFALAS
jgi:two-component system chemotaxis response regulator CheY